MNLDNRSRLFLCSLIIVVVISAVFWPVRSHDFLDYDDDYLVFANHSYDNLSFETIKSYWKGPKAQIYMPLTSTVWALLAQIARTYPSPDNPAPSQFATSLDPEVFHALSIVLHVANCLLAFCLLRMLIKKDWAACLGALFFGLHPIQVEAVAWISEQKGLLSSFFGLIALCCYTAHLLQSRQGSCDEKASPANVEMPKEPADQLEKAGPAATYERPAGNQLIANHATGRGARFLYWAALSAFILAMFSKPAAVSIALVVFIIDFFLIKRPLKVAVWWVSPWFVMALPIVWMARQAQYIVEQISPMWTRPLIMTDALAFYLSKILWPAKLSYEYSRSPDWVYEKGYIFWTWLLPASVAVVIWANRRRLPTIVAAGLMFVATILPVSGLVPFVFQYYSTVADRYAYMPLLGVALAVAYLLSQIRSSTKKKIAIGLCVLLMAIYTTMTLRQIGLWNDREVLYRHALSLNNRAWSARVNLSNILNARGDKKSAVRLLREAGHLHPRYAEVYVNLGNILSKNGRDDLALDYFIKATELSPTLAPVYRSMGLTYLKIKEYKYAVLAFRRGRELEPDNVQSALHLLNAYLKNNQINEAKNLADEIKPIFNSEDSYHASVALVMVQNNHPEMALPHYLEAVKIRPYDSMMHNNVAMTLLQLGRFKDAVKVLGNAIEINPKDPQLHFNMAIALLGEERRSEALDELRKTSQLNPDYPGMDKLLTQIKKRDS